jgi:hypothetical protein
MPRDVIEISTGKGNKQCVIKTNLYVFLICQNSESSLDSTIILYELPNIRFYADIAEDEIQNFKNFVITKDGLKLNLPVDRKTYENGSDYSFLKLYKNDVIKINVPRGYNGETFRIEKKGRIISKEPEDREDLFISFYCNENPLFSKLGNMKRKIIQK